MAQDEMMVVPVEPTREMWAAGGNAVIGYKQRHHDKVVADIWSAMLSAAPAQPAAVEGAGGWDREICTGCSSSLTVSDIQAGGFVSCCPDRRMVKVSDLVEAFETSRRAYPSPTPAAEDGRSEPDDPTEEMIQAALEVDFDNEDERGAVINLWHVMKAAAPPAADDALRVAAEALEDAAHEAHGRGYVQGFADAVWDETGDYDEKALTENLDPEKLRDGWYDDARHTYRDAQTEALAALKAEKK